MSGTYKRYFHWYSNLETTCSVTTGRFNKMEEGRIFTTKLKIGVGLIYPCFIDKDHWPPNSPDLNPLDYCIGDEFARAINWDLVTSKTALINELKRGVKKIRSKVVFESCTSWTNRLYRLRQANGNCLSK